MFKCHSGMCDCYDCRESRKARNRYFETQMRKRRVRDRYERAEQRERAAASIEEIRRLSRQPVIQLAVRYAPHRIACTARSSCPPSFSTYQPSCA